jgi:hypothetical protein
MKSFYIIKRFSHIHSPSNFSSDLCKNCNKLTKEDLLEIEKKLQYIAHQGYVNKMISITSFFLAVTHFSFK